MKPSASQPRNFTISVRAHDGVRAADTSYSGVSVLQDVKWPDLPASVGTWTSLGFIVAVLALTTVLSLRRTRHDARADASPAEEPR